MENERTFIGKCIQETCLALKLEMEPIRVRIWPGRPREQLIIDEIEIADFDDEIYYEYHEPQSGERTIASIMKMR